MGSVQSNTIRMKLFFLVLALALFHKGKAAECPMYGTDILFNDIDDTADVASWILCGQHCQTTDGCECWTWNTETLHCFTHTSDINKMTNSVAISGDKNCP